MQTSAINRTASCLPCTVRCALSAAIFLLVAVLAQPAPPLGAEETSRWTLRASGAWLSPTGDQVTTVPPTAPPGNDTTTLEVNDDATGYGLAVEYRRWPHLGFETGVLRMDMDTRMRLDIAAGSITDTDTVSISSVHLAANWHFTPDRRADVSLSPIVAQTSFKDVFYFTEIGLSEKRTFDDDVGFGVKAAVEVPLDDSRKWALFADLRYLDMILEGEVAGQDLAFDPTILTAGLSFRF